eukprot:3323628-Rhodomonas_salina.1
MSVETAEGAAASASPQSARTESSSHSSTARHRQPAGCPEQGKGREREAKRRAGKGREGKGREGKGREAPHTCPERELSHVGPDAIEGGEAAALHSRDAGAEQEVEHEIRHRLRAAVGCQRRALLLGQPESTLLLLLLLLPPLPQPPPRARRQRLCQQEVAHARRQPQPVARRLNALFREPLLREEPRPHVHLLAQALDVGLPEVERGRRVVVLLEQAPEAPQERRG